MVDTILIGVAKIGTNLLPSLTIGQTILPAKTCISAILIAKSDASKKQLKEFLIVIFHNEYWMLTLLTVICQITKYSYASVQPVFTMHFTIALS